MSGQLDDVSLATRIKLMKLLPTGSQWIHHSGRTYQIEGIYLEADLGVYFVAHRNVETGEKFIRSVANFTGIKGEHLRFVPAA